MLSNFEVTSLTKATNQVHKEILVLCSSDKYRSCQKLHKKKSIFKIIIEKTLSFFKSK